MSGIDALKNIIKARPVDNWYDISPYKWTKLAYLSADELSRMFFPVEVLDEYSLDFNQKYNAGAAFRLYSRYISAEEDRLVSVYSLEIGPKAYRSKSFFHIELASEFSTFVSHCTEGTSPQMRIELGKMDLVNFTSEDMVEPFFERSCPLIYDYIEKWRLLSEIKCLAE